MSDDNRFTVLVSLDKGVTWKHHAGISAKTNEQACRGVRDTFNYGNEALYYATSSFKPRKMEPVVVEKWEMQQIDIRPQTETPPDAAA